MKIKETLDHHLEIFDELECIAKHPLLTGKAKFTYEVRTYKKGLNETTKGLATRPNKSPELEVEQRSLLVYKQLEGGDIS
ncbi:hypothetical protein KW850_19205 [Bacillus sp. sid0103]|uniref:hypothetical protein n=1 Tax=Bacillus sp. sid0103 TaxID=2856337 RepID=UPI001C4391C1|nr:hypothetical protein [Bacillus sp. sid0103]MBV7507371.1 hypothetical protein [Bacillus sp. sid0103]